MGPPQSPTDRVLLRLSRWLCSQREAEKAAQMQSLDFKQFKLISAEATVALWWLSLVSGDTECLQKASTENDVLPMLSS